MTGDPIFHTSIGFIVITRYVLTGPPPPQQQPLDHGQQLCEVSSPSKIPMKGNGSESKFAICKMRPSPSL